MEICSQRWAAGAPKLHRSPGGCSPRPGCLRNRSESLRGASHGLTSKISASIHDPTELAPRRSLLLELKWISLAQGVRDEEQSPWDWLLRKPDKGFLLSTLPFRSGLQSIA